ncbi:hypothetical protein FHX15_005144 [Rhizobium sp. BK650]|uniref:RES domain-containing protein n=1 Tax=Rhizobium sp. BK650 TaxID=2586990 RepID=UPI0016204F70|nr:RES domain-containing protein [Rhizobium sp. BK650]MBB3659876.1 hypothetical protein [Rhizobium sp. BK650]
MTGIKPPAGFEHSSLDLEVLPSGSRFGRIYASVFPDPLGFGKTPSRFSDPRRRDAAKQFGVLYLGDTLKVCFLEAVLRDRRDGLIGDLPIEENEIHARRFAEIETTEELGAISRASASSQRGTGSLIRTSRASCTHAPTRRWSR